MAAPTFTCNLNTLIQNSACFRDLCLSNSDRRGIDVYLKSASLSAVGGTNYVSNIPQLMKDSSAWVLRAKHELDAIEIWIDWQNALNLGATLPATAKGIITAALACRDIGCLGPKQLNGINSFLKCQLNTRIEPE